MSVERLMISMWEEQAQLFQAHAARLRKALKDNGEDVPDAPVAKKGKAKLEPGEKAVRKTRGEKKVTKKRALSAYQVFMKEHLKSYKQRHPELQQTEVLKVIATRWGKLEDDKKAKYGEQAKVLKEEFLSHQAEAEAAAGGGEPAGFAVVPLTGDKTKKRKHDEKENNGAHASSNDSATILSPSQAAAGDDEGGKKKKKKKDKSQE